MTGCKRFTVIARIMPAGSARLPTEMPPHADKRHPAVAESAFHFHEPEIERHDHVARAAFLSMRRSSACERARELRNMNRPLQSALAMIVASLTLASAQAAELLERAVLPSDTFSSGPTSGQFATGGNGVATPFINRQPVQGFSAVLPGPFKGTYMVMSDNGFGAKANSPDALLRVDFVRPDFEAGTVAPVN